MFGNQPGRQPQRQHDHHRRWNTGDIADRQIVILRRHPAVGDRAAAVGIDAFGAAGDKPGAEGGEERTNLADKDQEGVQQADNHPAEQRAAHRCLPRQVPGFERHQRKGSAEIKRDADGEVNRPGANDKGHRHRHDQQNRAALQKIGPVIEGQKYRVRPAEQGNRQQGNAAESRPRKPRQRGAAGLTR